MTPRPAYLRTLVSLVRHRHGERQDVRAFQARSLRRLVRHAAERVPYYRDLFADQGLDPGEIRSADDLGRVPVTTRRRMQSEPARRLLAEDVDDDRLLTVRTSGSSGMPLTIHRTRAERLLRSYFRIRTQRFYGIDRSDRIVRLSSRRETLSLGLRARRFLTPFGPYRVRRVDLRQEIDQIVSELVAYRPTVLMGPAAPLLRLARALDAPTRDCPDLRLVLNGAETLPPWSRQVIEGSLEVPVRDWYGSWEAGLIGWECPQTGAYHLCDDAVIVEVLDDGEPVPAGEEGEVAITVLHSYAMPIVRYHLGDVAVRGEDACSCGAPFSTLFELRGRTVDYFRLPDGRTVHPWHVAVDCLHGANWIAQCQVVQERVDRIRVRVLPRASVADDRLRALERCLSEGLGEGVRVDVERVSSFPVKADKFRSFRSLVGEAVETADLDG